MTERVGTGRVDRVVLILTILGLSVSLCSLIVDANWPSEEPFSFTSANQTFPRLLLYWFTGSAFAIASAFVWHQRLVLARSLAYSGAYLMLLGINNGVWGTATYMPHRIAARAVSLTVALVVAARTRNPNVVASA